MDKQKRVKTECSNCGSDMHVTRKCTSSKCGECGKTFKSAPERSAHWKREHLGKGSMSRSDDDKPAREHDADNSRKQNRTKKEPYLSKKVVHYQDEESSAVDSEFLSDDESRLTTDDEFDPNSS